MRFLFFLLLIISTSNVFAGTHRAYTCISDQPGVDIIFTYSTAGKTSGSDTPGYCKIDSFTAANSRPEPYEHFFCWVMDTQTDITDKGDRALLFKDFLGDGAYLYYQLNIPMDSMERDSFNGKIRLLSRAPKNLQKSLSEKNAANITCTASDMEFIN